MRTVSQTWWKQPLVWIVVSMLLSNLLVYLPFLFSDFTVIYRHYDGPFYTYIAKTFYQIPDNHPFQQAFPAKYYAGHFPLYPMLIRVMTIFTLGHYPLAMVLATVISSIGSALLFYILLKEWKLVSAPLWISILFCFLPARWLLQHSIGATEPLFLCLVFGAFIAYGRKNHWIVLLCLSLACITRPPGFLVVAAFGLIYLWQKNWRMVLLLPLTLVSLLALLFYHHYVYGDFFAPLYAHTSRAFVSSATKASSITAKPPLEIFRFYAERPNFHSTELFLALYTIHLVGMLSIWKKKELFFYCLINFVFLLFVFNYELTRYLIPIAPFALLIGFESFLSRRAFQWVVFPFYLYLAYTFVWGFLPLATCSRETLEIMMDQYRSLP